MPVLTPAPPRAPQLHLETANPNIGYEAVIHEPQVEPYGLFPFQARAAKHLTTATATSGVLISRSGLGKSVVAAAVGAEILLNTEVERVVILTPPVITHTWAHIITKTTGHEDVVTLTGSQGERWRTYANDPSRWLVVPYSVLSTDVEVMLPLMASSLVIICQAHNIKNPRAARSAAALRLNEAANRRLMLLGPGCAGSFEEWSFLVATALAPAGDHRQALREITTRAGMNPGNTSMLTLTL
jgi:superfamily II DNA or RNA helicase